MVVSEEIAGERSPRRQASVAAPGFREPLWAWGLLAVLVVLTFVTYTRIGPEQLYQVSRGGVAGGLGRTLVELNFPVAIAAIPILGLCAARIRRPAAAALAAVGVVLRASVAVIFDKSDLDARPANALPALGVAVAVALTVWALRTGGLGASRGFSQGDAVRIALAVAACLVSIPWLFAEAGFYAPEPILADEVVSREIVVDGVPTAETLPAVHLGSHHGTDGIVLLLSALLLSRGLPSIRGRLGAWISGSLALMLAYGAIIATEDFWLEQVVKRGTVDRTIPDLTLPSLSWGWLAILLVAVVVEVAWFRPERSSRAAVPAPATP
jgi:hypothetical protein